MKKQRVLIPILEAIEENSPDDPETRELFGEMRKHYVKLPHDHIEPPIFPVVVRHLMDDRARENVLTNRPTDGGDMNENAIRELSEHQMVEFAQRMRKERDAAREQLLKYGHHVGFCLMGPTCYCGWEELKRELERKN